VSEADGTSEATHMNISPRILSWSLIPMSLAHLGASIELLADLHQHTVSTTPFFWKAIFYPGGIVLMFVASMLIIIRRGEHTHFQLIDKIALATAAGAIFVFAATCRNF
jgi:hypothetical protein